MISEKAVIHPNVRLGSNCNVEDHAIIGAPLRGDDPFPETIIGDNAVIRSHTVIYAGNRIGNYFQTGNKANIRELNVIGDNVSIGTMSVVEHHVRIEKGVRLHSQVFVPEYCVLKEGCWLGPHVVLTNARYPNTSVTKENLEGVVVGKGAVIGANSTVLPGSVLGDNCLIGAGSVVTKDVPPQRLVYGNPAVERGWICQCGLVIDEIGGYRCSACGTSYELEGCGIRKKL